MQTKSCQDCNADVASASGSVMHKHYYVLLYLIQTLATKIEYKHNNDRKQQSVTPRNNMP